MECEDFVVDKNLASALSQSRDLSVLVFRVESVAISGIIQLTKSLKSLSVFHIYTASDCGFRTTRTAGVCARLAAFVKSLRETSERQGRFIDLKIDIKQNFRLLECPDLFRWYG